MNRLIACCGIFGIGTVLAIGFGISDKLDKRTPEQKKHDAQEEVLSGYRKIERTFPSMELDGKVVPADLQWSTDEMVFTAPKTYGFTATRFAQQSASVSRTEFRTNAKDYNGHFFVNVPINEWSGPNEFQASCLIAIPKEFVPDNFRATPYN